MKTKVTDEGVLIPKQWLGEAEEVEIRREENIIVVVPLKPEDPILELGKHPVTTDVDDASVNHDHYIATLTLHRF